MAMKMNDFIKKYYMQLHFNSMPTEVRAQFDDWVRSDSLTDEMRLWTRDYLQHDANGNLLRDNVGYINNPLPDPQNANDITDAELQKIFIAFQNAFISMASVKSDLSSEQREFVEYYFGPSALFNINAATDTEKDYIESIRDVIGQNDSLKIWLQENVKKDNGTDAVFDDVSAINTFLTDLGDSQKKYNTDYKTQQKVRQVARALRSAIQSWNNVFENEPGVEQALHGIAPALEALSRSDAFSGDGNIAPEKFRQFRDGSMIAIMNRIYNDQNIYSVFKEHDNGKFSKHIDKARKVINWQDDKGPNYVPPKTSDELTLGQRIEKWVSDTYSDTLKKYEQLRGGTMAFRPESKDIFKAIDANNIKPTDGLTGLLDKDADVKKKIRNPVSKQHWEWFVETMGPIKDSMPKAVAGAWKNARQMKAVVQEIMIKGADPNNPDPHAMEKAKTAMEIMTAMKYGMMTSKVMDAIRNEPMTIFSDSKLSFNNDNKAMAFVTDAFDKSIKAAFLGVGYGITFVRNKIMLSNRKIKDRDNTRGRLGQYYQAERNRLAAEQATFNADRNFKDNQDRAQRRQLRADIRGLGQPGHRYTPATIAQREAERTAQQTIRDNNRALHEQFVSNQSVVTDYTNRGQAQVGLQNQLNTKNNEIAAKRAELRRAANPVDPTTGQPLPPGAAHAIQARLQQELDELITQRDEIQSQLNDSNAWLRDPANISAYQNAHAFINTPANINANQQYENAANAYDTLNNDITQYHDAQRQIAELNDSMQRRADVARDWPQTHQNKLKELEDFWNFLQAGNATTWAFSQKRAQARFDAQKNQLLSDFVQSHGVRA